MGDLRSRVAQEMSWQIRELSEKHLAPLTFEVLSHESSPLQITILNLMFDYFISSITRILF